MESVRSTGRPIEVNHGRPDPTRSHFPPTTSQKASRQRKAERRAGTSEAAALAVGVILRATPAQIPTLLNLFHTLDSRVRVQVISQLRPQHAKRAKQFEERLEG